MDRALLEGIQSMVYLLLAQTRKVMLISIRLVCSRNFSHRNKVHRLEKGSAITNEEGKQIEHFGFRDGVSHPLIKGIDDEAISQPNYY